MVVGLIQGVTELFPVSSLGHNVLLPALIGGSWAKDLNVSKPESPYLAFIVGLHVATAIGLTIYFWRDWVRIIRGFFSLASADRRDIRDHGPEAGLDDHPGHHSGRPDRADLRARVPGDLRRAESGPPIFLVINGLILFAAERFRTRKSRQADAAARRRAENAKPNCVGAGAARAGAAHASGQRALRQQEIAPRSQADRRLAAHGLRCRPSIIGSAQILALLAGISRDGVTMVAGMFRGLSSEDAARFAFLLATPVILAAGVLKVPDLIGPLGHGIQARSWPAASCPASAPTCPCGS